ncbi:DnaJ-like protein xdj1, partial [Dipsacomyces acuminosporus]
VAARQVAPGLISQQQVSCQSCHGTGKVIPDKYRCKRCNGERVVDQKDTVEIKIERGSSDGQAIVLRGKGDQKPGQDPSDLVFVLRQKPHARFVRTGDDLTAEAEIDLAEALCGVSRVLVTQLDGRELEVTHRSGVIKPGDVVCIHNEGMPREKRPRDKGDLFIRFSIRFPDKTWRPNATLASLLPATKWPAPADDARVEVVTARPISAQEFESRTQPKHASYDYDGYAADTGPECQQQ